MFHFPFSRVTATQNVTKYNYFQHDLIKEQRRHQTRFQSLKCTTMCWRPGSAPDLLQGGTYCTPQTSSIIQRRKKDRDRKEKARGSGEERKNREGLCCCAVLKISLEYCRSDVTDHHRHRRGLFAAAQYMDRSSGYCWSKTNALKRPLQIQSSVEWYDAQ